MKKLFTVILLALVLGMMLVAGCKKADDTGSDDEVVADSQDTQDDSDDDVVTTTEEDEDKQEEAPQMSEELQELLSGLDKVKSYHYAYQSGTPEAKKYYVKGDKILVELMEKKRWKSGEFYNKVLLDLDDKTAHGFCTDRDICNDEQRSIAKKVSFSEYMPDILPKEYAESITHGDIVGTENIENRPATIVEFEDDSGNTVDVSINNYYGMPMRIVTETPTGTKKEIMFTEMGWNSVDDSDVEFPKEIMTIE
ncbi:hypothetical protein GF351_04940 [Candidatus Woesearchaeota archaeon]|nr:hypothetical protein [Candidatus Woesearchaeota archaeon]